jgi:hypothetical protein
MRKYLVIYYKGHDIGRHILNVAIVPAARDAKHAKQLAAEFTHPPKGCSVSAMAVGSFNHNWSWV